MVVDKEQRRACFDGCGGPVWYSNTGKKEHKREAAVAKETTGTDGTDVEGGVQSGPCGIKGIRGSEHVGEWLQQIAGTTTGLCS